MHITITGMLGSGKSTVGKIISEVKGYELYSTGSIQRMVAQEKGLSTLELNKLMHTVPDLDNTIDSTTVKIANENKDKSIIFDSRMAWHFVPESFKVFLTVNDYEAARRVVNADRGQVEGYTSIEDARYKLKERALTEHQRFLRIYQANYWNFDNYDLVLDATWHDAETLAYIIMGQLETFLEEKEKVKTYLISPKSLYPANVDKLKDLDLSRVINKDHELDGFDDDSDDNLNPWIYFKDFYPYIIGKYKRVEEALFSQIELIPAFYANNLLAEIDSKFNEDAIQYDQELGSKYEELGKFKYKSYPL